jgi:DNA-binding NarL/FixJ family response regulator
MRILLVDDHALFLQSLRILLMSAGHEVVGMASEGTKALRQARAQHPDLILMDIDMPVCGGLEATRLIKAELPEIKIVMLTVSSSDENLFEAIKSGASGYILKSQDADKVLEMIDEVAAGGAALLPELAARLLEDYVRQARRAELLNAAPDELTPRQAEILVLVSQGLTYAQVGAALFLTEPTVRYHMGQIIAQLHLENRAQVIAYAASHGLGKSPSA